MTPGSSTASAPPERWRLRTLFAARMVSVLGGQLTMVALPWFVLVTTGSPARMGLVSALETAVFALSTIPVGMLVDRWGARRTMLASDLWFAALVAAIPTLQVTGLLSFPLLVALVCLIAIPQSGYLPCIQVSIKDLVGSDPKELAKASSERMLITQLSSVTGRAGAGALLALGGAMTMLFADAVSYLVSFALLAVALPRRAVRPSQGGGEPRPRWWAGFRFIWGHPILAALFMGSALQGLCFAAQFLTVPVVVARGGYDRGWLGYVLAGVSVGTIVGALLVRQVTAGWPMARTVMTGLVLTLAGGLLPALAGTHPALLTAAFVAFGLGGALVGASTLTIISAEAPEGSMGLVMASWMMVANLAGPLATLGAGLAMERLTPRAVWVAAAVLAVVAFALQVWVLRRRGRAKAQT